MSSRLSNSVVERIQRAAPMLTSDARAARVCAGPQRRRRTAPAHAPAGAGRGWRRRGSASWRGWRPRRPGARDQSAAFPAQLLDHLLALEAGISTERSNLLGQVLGHLHHQGTERGPGSPPRNSRERCGGRRPPIRRPAAASTAPARRGRRCGREAECRRPRPTATAGSPPSSATHDSTDRLSEEGDRRRAGPQAVEQREAEVMAQRLQHSTAACPAAPAGCRRAAQPPGPEVGADPRPRTGPGRGDVSSERPAIRRAPTNVDAAAPANCSASRRTRSRSRWVCRVLRPRPPGVPGRRHRPSAPSCKRSSSGEAQPEVRHRVHRFSAAAARPARRRRRRGATLTVASVMPSSRAIVLFGLPWRHLRRALSACRFEMPRLVMRSRAGASRVREPAYTSLARSGTRPAGRCRPLSSTTRDAASIVRESVCFWMKPIAPASIACRTVSLSFSCRTGPRRPRLAPARARPARRRARTMPGICRSSRTM